MTAIDWFLVMGLIIFGCVIGVIVAQNTGLRESLGRQREETARWRTEARNEAQRARIAEELEFQAHLQANQSRKYTETVLAFNRTLIAVMAHEEDVAAKEKKAPQRRGKEK